jgi:hypothetical protein
VYSFPYPCYLCMHLCICYWCLYQYNIRTPDWFVICLQYTRPLCWFWLNICKNEKIIDYTGTPTLPFRGYCCSPPQFTFLPVRCLPTMEAPSSSMVLGLVLWLQRVETISSFLTCLFWQQIENKLVTDAVVSFNRCAIIGWIE